jgi:transposase
MKLVGSGSPVILPVRFAARYLDLAGAKVVVCEWCCEPELNLDLGSWGAPIIAASLAESAYRNSPKNRNPAGLASLCGKELAMEVLYARCAGLDVHKKTVVACRVFTPGSGRKQQEVRTFGTTTRELLALLDWLREGGCTHVAMESTGEYWKPVYNLLEGHAELLLVNPQHCKNVPGRKTDVKDAEWLADLLRHGLVKGSFVPPRPQRELRDLTRGRCNLIEERTRIVNRLQKVLEDANIKLGDVASDVTGVSGRAMLSALCRGETDAEALADLARGVLQKKRDALAEALEGRVTAHHRFLLTQHLEHLAFVETRIAGFD